MNEPPKQVVRVQFGTYNDDEIKCLSVMQVTNSRAFDQVGHATRGGLYDRRMGPIDRNEICATCSLGELKCPGHMAHIELPMPVYNPFLFKHLELLARGSCFNCKRIMDDTAVCEFMLCMIRLLDADLWDKLDELKLLYSDTESLSNSKLVQNMRDFTNKVVQEAEEKASETEPVERKTLRFPNMTRQELMEQYMSAVFVNRKGHCKHCSVPIRRLRRQYNVRMIFDEGASKNAIAKAKRHFLTKKKKALKAQKGKVKKEVIDEGYGDDESLDSEVSDEFDDDNPDSKVLNVDEGEMDERMENLKGRALLTARALREHMRKVWDTNTEVMKAICGTLNIPMKGGRGSSEESRPTDIFFFEVIPVPPNRFRPVAKRSGSFFEHPSNTLYSEIIEVSDSIKECLRTLQNSDHDPNAVVDTTVTAKEQAYDKLHNHLETLQNSVNNILDRNMSKKGKLKPPGVRQVIEKKQGLFRQHMMGKRVDFAARSVISPDPFIAVDEVGLPEVFATKLTFPEPVNAHNVERLRRAVLNGPNIYPGATHVVSERGIVTHLNAADIEMREALSKTLISAENENPLKGTPKTVLRHIINGDMLLMNRQPTLHRPSIQAHKAHILPGEKTIRLHYANCNAYNADFDGDEMNAHFPQSFLGQSEARQIVTTHNQYLVPKNGAPLAGLIQDHVIGGVTLSMRGRFFNKEQYQQLVFCGLVSQEKRVEFLPPAIIKPIPLWTGKQIVSTILRTLLPGSDEEKYINLTGASKISAKSWINSESKLNLDDAKLGEETVVFRQGYLLQGVIDKNHFGATKNGLVHYCYELYGGAVSSQLLTSLARLFTTFLKYRGFSLGVEDILCMPKADKTRLKIMAKGSNLGADVIAKTLNVDNPEDNETLAKAYASAHFDRDDMKMKEIDMSMKSISDSIQNDITKTIMPAGLLKKFPHNNLQLMTVAGAKGSSVNCMQISCLLGQIELEGRRPPLTMSGRSLPSFSPYETTPRAGGFVDGRFLTGIRPQEYFFHCMAGREGLVDTAVKTSRSGYLQRCLIKHLEGILVSYDSTVRDCDGSVMQFSYGEDGMSVLKTNLLTTSQIPFLVANKKALMSGLQAKVLAETLDKKKAKKWDQKIKDFKHTWQDFSKSDRRGVFLKFTEGTTDSMKSATKPIKEKLCRTKEAKVLQNKYRELSEEDKEPFMMYADRCPDPTLSKYAANRYLYSLPERLREEVDKYMEQNPDGLLASKKDGRHDKTGGRITTDDLDELIACYSCKCRVEPGDGVGILAAQSIGEPSTQMTLNTFHFAGRGEMNVTLGIPRLRELLMVASKSQKTPFMDIPFKQTKHALKRAKNLHLRLNSAKVSEVLHKAEVVTKFITKGQPSEWAKLMTLKFEFLPPSQYTDKCYVTPQAILQHIESVFIKDLMKSYLKASRQAADTKISQSELLTSQMEYIRRRADVDQLDADDESDDEMQMGRDKKSERKAKDSDADDDEIEEMVDEAGADHDAEADKEIARHNEEHDYDGEEDEVAELLGDNTAGKSDDDNDDDGESVMSSVSSSSSDEEVEFDKLDATSLRKKIKKAQLSSAEMIKKRIQTVLGSVPGMVDYQFDTAEERWCIITFKFPLSNIDIDMSPIIKSVAKHSLVCDPEKIVKGVSKAILSQPKNDKDPIRLKTDGVNIQRMFMYDDILDLNNLYSNDIHAMAATYGIEAARSVLLKEVRDVFAAYGITVNFRHLSLIADYMMHDGEYKACNRIGLMPSASLLQKMTFESSSMYLRTAMFNGAADDVDSPSARLVVGRPVKCGTGLFDCMMRLSEE